jgi:putative ribosome biogenesis GTPase RsgA
MKKNELDFLFEDIEELSRLCKYTNCTHNKEPHCAVKEAISEGVLSINKFNTYYRDKNEEEHILRQKNKTKAVDYMKQRKLFRD